MDLRTPVLLAIGISIIAVVLIAAHLLVRRRRQSEGFKDGVRVANTSIARNLAGYKKALRLHNLVIAALEAIAVIAAIAAIVLACRPSDVNVVKDVDSRKDVFLCLDVSGSCVDQNMELIESFKEIVKHLNGERVGVTLFNSSSVVYIPLTDDYEFVQERLDALYDSFNFFWSYGNTGGDSADRDIAEYYLVATEARSHRGSSIIGEGLASCLYSFPHLDDGTEAAERTRVIIMSTDNEDLSAVTPEITLPEAAQLCDKHDVKVFGLYPASGFYYDYGGFSPQARDEYKRSVELTGGKFYAKPAKEVDDVVDEIARLEGLSINEGRTSIFYTDDPAAVYAVLIGIIVAFLAARAVMRK